MGATYVFAKQAAAPEYDRSLAWTALLLLAVGLVMVYSASIATAEASRFTGQQRRLLPAAARDVPRHCACARHRRVPGAGALLAEGRAVAVSRLRRAPGAGAGARHRARGERRAPLDQPGRRERAALRTDEARGGALRRRLHGAQARGDEELPARAAADAGGDDVRVVAAAARTRFRRAGGDRRHHLRHPVSRRHERPALRRARRHARRGLRAAGAHFRSTACSASSASWIRGPIPTAGATSSRTR